MRNWKKAIGVLLAVGLGLALGACGDNGRNNNNNRNNRNCFTDNSGRRVCDNFGGGGRGFNNRNCGFDIDGFRCDSRDMGLPECQFDMNGRRCNAWGNNWGGNGWGNNWGGSYCTENFGPGFIEIFGVGGTSCIPFSDLSYLGYQQSYGAVSFCSLGSWGCMPYSGPVYGAGISAGFGVYFGIGF